MGENMVNLIPQHLRATGQINDAEFKDLSKKFANYVNQLADVDKIGLGSLDDSRYYLYQLSEIERVKKDLDAAVNPSTKKALQNKIDGLQKSIDNLIEGKEVNYVKFKFSNGASFVMSEEDAAKTIKDMNPITNMMGAEITNSQGEKVPMLTMETTNSKLNAAQQEIFKKQEKRKEATGVEGINIGEQYGGASVNNNVKIEGVIASSTASEANAKARIEEARLAQTYLDEQMPGVKIVMFNGKDYNAFMPKVKGKADSAGNIAIKYNEKTKKYEVEIHINLDKANSRTIGHEVTHAVLLKSFGEDIGKFTEFRQTMSKLLSESDNKALNDFGRNYAIDVQAEEYLAELSGLMQSQGKTIEKGVFLKMMTYISDFVSKLTGGKVQPFKNVQNTNEAIDFFNSLTEKLSTVKNAVQEQTAGQVPVQPETRTSEEVAQGESQAETQVAPQEGQEEVILESIENPLTTADVIGREIEQGYEVFDDVITIDANKGQTDRGPITSKSQTTRDFELNDSDFVDVKTINGKKAIGFLGDVQLTGTIESPTGVKLNGGGGPFFPKQANRNLKIDKDGYYIGRAALWASTFEDSTNKLAKKFRGVDVAMIGTQQITGILGNRKMLLYFGDELQAAIERGNSEESIINYINSKLDSTGKKPKGAEESISLRKVLGDVDNFNNTKEFIDYLDPFLSNEEFTNRHGFSRKVTTPITYETRSSLFVKIFNIDAHKKFALPSIVPGKGYSYDKTVLDYGNDEAFKDAGYGDFVGYVEFDPETIKLEKVDENSDFYNPSYPWVITAEKVRVKYFNKFIDGRAIFYDNKPASITANQTPFGLREKDQAARAIMGAMPITTIEAKKVKQRQKGFESKSQLTEPSSNKWSPSLTQAEVDNIVGGDFASTLDEKVKEGKKHSTQIATTIGTYNKWVTWLEKNVPDFKNAEVLDVGAGLGHIHKAFGNKAGAVESYEPFYDKVQYQKYAGIQKPNYSQMDASDVPVGKYDVVVNNAVLNVVPSDIRESILNTIGDALKPGGIAIINAMDQGYLNSLIKKIDAGQSKNIKLSDTEVFVRESGKNSYQKGWTTQELQSYVQDVLGNKFTVEKAPSEITSMTTVLIKKNAISSKSQLADTITESKKLGVPQRYKGDVGKFIGGDLYVHKSAMDVLPQEAMERAMAKLPQGFDFEVVKYNSQSGAFSFIASPDWNTNPEPIVGDAYKVTADGNVTVTKQKADPQIYHHKWNFVRDNYTGFDIQESVQRSIDWFQSVRPNVNMFKIGTQSYWQNEALPNLKTTETGFESKSQIDNANIAPEYQNAIASGKTPAEAYGDLIKTAYTNKAIKDALGNSFDQAAYDAAVEKDALAIMNTLEDAMQQNIDDVKDVINQNYISLNDTSALSDIRSDLKDQGYSDLSIFTAFLQLDFATPEQLQEVFGAEYRKTVQDALNRKTDFSSDFLDDLSEDAQNLKITNRAADLTNAFVENGLTFVDAAVGIEYLLNYLDKAGLLPMASTLRDSLKDMKNDPKEVQKFFQTFSQLSSMAGRILNMARFIFEKQLNEMIADSLRKNGIVLTAAQEKELQNLVGDFNLANQQVKENQKALEEDFSDEAFNKFWGSEKELGLANTRLFKFLDARKPNFWNDRITSGGARGLLNFGTTVLSFTANVENNLYSTNPVTKGIQKLRDNWGNGIKGNTLSFANWRMARELTKRQSNFAMEQAFKYGNVQDINTLNRYYDGLGQVNFFRDAHWTSKFVRHFIKQVTGKEPLTMTDEEFVDAFDQTLIRMKDGDIKLRDGRAYTIAKSFFWTLSLGPQASELTGRVMAYGGDIMFGQMATQRAIIDYLNNIKDTRFQDGYFDNQFKQANGDLNKEAIRAMSVMIYSNPDLKKKFEEEGLKRTLLADNFISKGFSFARGGIRKKVSSLYTEISREQKGLLSIQNIEKQVLQSADVLLWTLMPFSKVPANFLGSALVKTIPEFAMGKYVFSESAYQKATYDFNKKHPIGKKYVTETQKQNYEKDKIELFAKKRQATYDLAQIVTAVALRSFALSAVKAGAILLADDKEKNKNLKGMNLRGGLYNASLHAEYLIANGQNLVTGATNFFGFTNKKPIETKAWLASRGGYAKSGDKIMNINNFGFVGYAMGLWGSMLQGSKNSEQEAVLSFSQYDKEGLWNIVNYAIGSGVENLPMFQGVARLGELVQDAKKEEGSGEKLANFMTGTFSTSLAVFFPSFGSFVSKGNADLVQTPGDIFPDKENSWAASYGKVILGTIQRLNRNVAFVEETKNPYYEAMIGPFGEDLSYRVTYAEPGTLGAYTQAMFDPFAVRKYSLPVKEADKDKKLHVRSAEVHAGLMDLAMMYQQLSGRDFEFKVEGQSASVFKMISSPMYNDFAFDGTSVTLMGPDSNRNPKVLNYNLPNDLYRQELKLKGELRANVFEGWRKDVADTKIKVDGLIQKGDYEQAEIELELMLNKFKSTSDLANEEYKKQYIDNRQKDYFIIMKQRGLITEDMMKQLQNVGIADDKGLISK